MKANFEANQSDSQSYNVTLISLWMCETILGQIGIEI